MNALNEKNEERVVLRFLWSRVAEHKRWIIFSLLFASGAALVQVQLSSVVQHVMDDAILPKNWERLLHFCGLIVALFLFDGATDFGHRICLRVATERTIRKLRREVFGRFLISSHAQASRSSSGQAVTNVLSDTSVIGNGLHVVADIMREPLILVALLARLVYMNWKLTIVCFVALPAVFSVGRWLGKKARRNQASIQRTVDSITSHIQETLRGLRTAHSFGQAAKLRDEFFLETDVAYKWLLKLARVEETVAPLTKWMTAWVGAGLILLCGWLVIEGTMTSGEVLSYITTAGLLQQPLRQLNNVNVRLQTVVAAGRRLHDVITRPLDAIGQAQSNLISSPAAQLVTVHHELPAPGLEFAGVSYRYAGHVDGKDDREFALRDLNLSIRPGARIALVGPSGSGKTTLSLLAMRFLDPSSGEVRLGGKPASAWDLGEFRSHFAYVSQDVFLFNRTLRENMLFAKPGAAEDEVWNALERAGIRDFVARLPERLDTNLSEHAANLSGGERQRIAIARAFLRDAPFLVLDEATSQLDSLSEQAVGRALSQLMQSRTVLVIAHRLSTIREMDQVAVFQNGAIVEMGRPEELLGNPEGHFSQLWAAQHGGARPGA